MPGQECFLSQNKHTVSPMCKAVEYHRGQDLGLSLGKALALSPLTPDGSLRERHNLLGPLMTYVQMGGDRPKSGQGYQPVPPTGQMS